MKPEIDEASTARAKSKIMAKTLLDFAKEFYLKPENKAKYEKWKEERGKFIYYCIYKFEGDKS